MATKSHVYELFSLLLWEFMNYLKVAILKGASKPNSFKCKANIQLGNRKKFLGKKITSRNEGVGAGEGELCEYGQIR